MSPSGRRLHVSGVLLAAFSLAALAASMVLIAATGPATSHVFRQEMVAQNVMVLALGVPGTWLLLKVPRHPAGWLLMSAATGLVLNSLGGAWAVYATTQGRDLPLAPVGLVLMRLAALSEAGVPLLLLLFPDGKLPSRRWRPALGAVLASCFALAVVALTMPLKYVFAEAAPGEVPESLRFLPDLTGLGSVPASWWNVVSLVVIIVDLGALLIALASLVFRYRRADPTQSAQLRWLAVGGLAMLVGVVVSRLASGPVGMAVSALATLVLAGTVVTAVLRYRLGDATLALNVSMVYVVLTALVVALYAGVVATVTVVIGHGAAPWFAAAVVAVAFAPLRSRLQALIDRWVRGERTDPYRVVSTLSRRLEASDDPYEVLRATVDTVHAAFRAQWVRIEIVGDSLMAAEGGTPTSSAQILPLEAKGERIGTLSLALPSGVTLSDRDLLLIADLVRHSSTVIQMVSTTRSLQEARARSVATREEERRRLRRDLHDGLGPQLAGLTLKLDAVRNLLARDPDRALELVSAAKSDVVEAVDDVRRLVHNLRPPALDELGLVGALQQQVSRFRRVNAANVTATDGFDVVIEASADMGELPAAVEVAAYRITSEALTNVARHAQARWCKVTLDRPDARHLDLVIIDDGIGLPLDHRSGVGLASMSERAAEVGGCCEIRAGECGGTVVRARLPMVTA